MHPKQAGMLTIIAVHSEQVKYWNDFGLCNNNQKYSKNYRMCGSFVMPWKSTNGNAVVVIPCLLPTKYAWGLAT